MPKPPAFMGLKRGDKVQHSCVVLIKLADAIGKQIVCSCILRRLPTELGFGQW